MTQPCPNVGWMPQSTVRTDLRFGSRVKRQPKAAGVALLKAERVVERPRRLLVVVGGQIDT